MSKEIKIEKETLEDIKSDLCVCKDMITQLCNHSEDVPDLKIGFELGQLQMIILRVFNDILEL